MNEHFDPLEAELAALKPAQPSPALRQRLADKLSGGVWVAPRPRSRRIWSTAAAIGGLVAACLTAALLLRHPSAGKSEPESPFAPLEFPVAAAFDDSLPTVWTYRRALAGPQQELDALLDKHASLAPSNSGRTPTHVYIGLDMDRLFKGEL